VVIDQTHEMMDSILKTFFFMFINCMVEHWWVSVIILSNYYARANVGFRMKIVIVGLLSMIWGWCPWVPFPSAC